MDSESPAGPVELPVTDELDLHPFRPEELGRLVPAYLAECRTQGRREIRVIHGKGRGEVARSVHAILGRLDWVESFALATPAFGGHGATIVRLRPAQSGELR